MGASADIGLIGLAVMGQNLVLNMNDHGFTVAVWNRTVSKVDDFLKGPAAGTKVVGAHTLQEFVSTLKRPRKIMMMVRAGEAVDELIQEILPFLEPGDVLIDGGNSNFMDTARRCADLELRGILFIGAGVSGGEEGARHGPSIMPGGNSAAWPIIKPIFQSIAAQVQGQPCCDWVGPGGAGHYVKMVHNGIEYGDMQLICEAYQLMRHGMEMSYPSMKEIFTAWNKTELNSYLIEITADILGKLDKDGSPILEKVLDVAGQKGTGKWTVMSALDEGIPATLIAEAVFARCLSAMKTQRKAASQLLEGPHQARGLSALIAEGDRAVESIRQALYASKIVSYAQGFTLMRQASLNYSWDLQYGSIAMMWRGGCIIRSGFLEKIRDAYQRQPMLEQLMLDPFFQKALAQAQDGWRAVVAEAARGGVPTPCFSSALAYYDGLRTERLPANLLQAQRDYFGAHTFKRIDAPLEQDFHLDWTGKGGSAHAGTYTV